MLSVCDEIQSVADGGERRPQFFERRFFEAHALERLRDVAKDAAQRRIGGERPRKGSALINWAMSRRTSSTVSKRIPLRAKNSPSGRLTVRITSVRGESALTSAPAASSAASGVVASTTAMIRSVR